MTELVIEARDLERNFVIGGGWGRPPLILRAVRGISLELRRGEVLALVGESGCGKSTLVRMLLGLMKPSGGTIQLLGKPLSSLGRRDVARYVQPVFQDPYYSLNPARRIGEIIGMPLVARGGTSAHDRRAKVARMMDLVGLPASFAERFPSQLSGGQRQRAAIARALIAEPRILICDEPTSALDVSVQAQILNLLQDLRQELGLSYLLVTHNLAVVENLADRVAVMYFGRIVEIGPTGQVLARPDHPYTRLLCDSALVPDPAYRLPEVLRDASLPDPVRPPTGCAFHPRCGIGTSLCARDNPHLLERAGRRVACHFPLSEPADAAPVATV